MAATKDSVIEYSDECDIANLLQIAKPGNYYGSTVLFLSLYVVIVVFFFVFCVSRWKGWVVNSCVKSEHNNIRQSQNILIQFFDLFIRPRHLIRHFILSLFVLFICWLFKNFQGLFPAQGPFTIRSSFCFPLGRSRFNS